MTKKAFIIRCAPSKISRLDEMIEKNQIVIGWSDTEDRLLPKQLSREDFKKTLIDVSPWYKDNTYSLGQATGYLWRFIREMNEGDYAIVPMAKAFYLGEITSEVIYLADRVSDDTALRRNVKWLNNGEPILRDYCGAGLISRLKYQGTCVEASDLMEDIEQSMILAEKKQKPNFKLQLREKLKYQVSEFLVSKTSYLSDTKFEDLVKQLLIGLGASTSEIPSKSRYKNSKADVDIIATFVHLGLQIYIQVKKHNETTDEYAIEQILEAIKIDNPDSQTPIFGWAITSGAFTPKADSLAMANGIRTIDGEELAEMILTVGLDKFN